MSFSTRSLFAVALAATLPGLLGGCAVAALAPLAVQGGSLVNGSSASNVQVKIDEQSFTPAVRSTLTDAKHWAVAAVARADIKMIDQLGTRGGFEVNVDRPAAKQGELTTSERREALRRMCESYKPDVALMSHAGSTSTGNTWAAAFTGRANATTSATMDVLDCRSRTPYAFDYIIAIDMGIWARQPRAQLEDAIATQTANALLAALGK